MSENEAATAEATEAATPEQPGHITFTTKADASKDARSIEITWPVGKDINESVEIFGAEVVHGMFTKALIVAAQANIRRMLGATKENSTDPKFSNEDIEKFVLTQYKPGVRAAGTGGGSAKSMEKLVAMLLKMTPEERKAELAKHGIEL